MQGFGKTGSLVSLMVLVTVLAGCSNKMMDPAQVGRFRPTPAVNVILDSLGVAEEAPVVWTQAQQPRPSDLVAVKGDYTLRAGDQVRISIFELYQEGVPVINDFVVSETGKISIQGVGIIQAAGLTETQLEEEIKEILSPATLKDPSVTVFLMGSQQRTFSILGDGIPQPSRYEIPRYDFRLTDALATAGGPMQFNVSNIYVTRSERTGETTIEPTNSPATDELELVMPKAGRSPSNEMLNSVLPSPVESDSEMRPPDIPEPSQPAEKFEMEREMLEMISPYAGQARDRDAMLPIAPNTSRWVPPAKTHQKPGNADNRLVSPSIVDGNPVGSRPVTVSSADGGAEWVFRDGKWVDISARAANVPPQPGTTEGQTIGDDAVEWVMRDGHWIQVRKGQAEPAQPPVGREPSLPQLPRAETRLPGEAEWDQAIQTRLIKIPAKELLNGDPRYNIIIKPGDTIHVPVDIIGEFCITGNVNRGGLINLTGRPMTLKMAIAAAGGLSPLAYPKYCEVVRRLGDEKEEIVMVDLDKIFSGELPDFFIKPNDLINVGTHPTSRFRAVLRNAFRAAYGFGFVYDRNFAYSEDTYGTPFL